ncbi:MAG: monovalent cation:proton antiporter-2 (CPA2) family protein [Vicinamibacteria bacterium]|nr:monovalent cation:proton antiporter-2 (CPA2) family protein [Vicinamibacteria bacterium]
MTFLDQAFVYLSAAVVAVPVARRLGLGSVLGYLIAGAAIGPYALGFVGAEGQDVLHFAEFGVVMMLFLVGLELEPATLWRLRTPILGLGGAQVAGCAAALGGLAWLLGVEPRAALAMGLTLAMSSTAIVLQSFAEKGLSKTAAGQSAFAVLLFQDIAVIPMLALFPLLAPRQHGGSAAEAEHAATWVGHLPAWGQTLAVLVAVAAVVAAGRFLVAPALRAIARTGLREMFTAAALLLVIGIALLMQKVGLSPALGTFLAGVVLATSEYRHELESDIEPFKGLLLGLFFIAVGASIDFALVAARPAFVAGLVAAILLAKLLVLLALGRGFGLATDQALLFAFALPQVGEFAFVLLAFATRLGLLSGELPAALSAAVALSMAATPLLFLACERLLLPRLGTRESAPREADAVDEEHAVVIAGFGRFGQSVGRLLRAQGLGATVLDNDSDRVELLRRLGFKVFYGDASRLDLLHAAGAARAKLLVLALDAPEKVVEMAREARRHFPQLTILARAEDREDAYQLLDAGVTHVYRETLDASLRMGADVLRLLGVRAYHAQRAARTFLRHDEESVRRMAPLRGDRAEYWSYARERIEDLERVLQRDREQPELSRDAGWDAESLREDANRGTLTAPPAGGEAR